MLCLIITLRWLLCSALHCVYFTTEQPWLHSASWRNKFLMKRGDRTDWSNSFSSKNSPVHCLPQWKWVLMRCLCVHFANNSLWASVSGVYLRIAALREGEDAVAIAWHKLLLRVRGSQTVRLRYLFVLSLVSYLFELHFKTILKKSWWTICWVGFFEVMFMS